MGTRADSGVHGIEFRDGESSGFNKVCTCSPWLLAELSVAMVLALESIYTCTCADAVQGMWQPDAETTDARFAVAMRTRPG